MTTALRSLYFVLFFFSFLIIITCRLPPFDQLLRVILTLHSAQTLHRADVYSVDFMNIFSVADQIVTFQFQNRTLHIHPGAQRDAAGPPRRHQSAGTPLLHFPALPH